MTRLNIKVLHTRQSDFVRWWTHLCLALPPFPTVSQWFMLTVGFSDFPTEGSQYQCASCSGLFTATS